MRAGIRIEFPVSVFELNVADVVFEFGDAVILTERIGVSECVHLQWDFSNIMFKIDHENGPSPGQAQRPVFMHFCKRQSSPKDCHAAYTTNNISQVKHISNIVISASRSSPPRLAHPPPCAGNKCRPGKPCGR